MIKNEAQDVNNALTVFFVEEKSRKHYDWSKDPIVVSEADLKKGAGSDVKSRRERALSLTTR